MSQLLPQGRCYVGMLLAETELESFGCWVVTAGKTTHIILDLDSKEYKVTHLLWFKPVFSSDAVFNLRCLAHFFSTNALCAFPTIPQATRLFKRKLCDSLSGSFILCDLVALQWFIDLTARVDALQLVDGVRAYVDLFHHPACAKLQYVCPLTYSSWQTWASYICTGENVMQGAGLQTHYGSSQKSL